MIYFLGYGIPLILYFSENILEGVGYFFPRKDIFKIKKLKIILIKLIYKNIFI